MSVYTDRLLSQPALQTRKPRRTVSSSLHPVEKVRTTAAANGVIVTWHWIPGLLVVESYERVPEFSHVLLYNHVVPAPHHLRNPAYTKQP